MGSNPGGDRPILISLVAACGCCSALHPGCRRIRFSSSGSSMTAITFMSAPHFRWPFAPLTARACIRGGRAMYSARLSWADSSRMRIVAAGAKPFPDLLDTLKAIPAVGGGVPLLVVLAEVGEMAFKDGMKFVGTTRNVPVPRRSRDRDCRAHINIYGRIELPASDAWLFHRSPHNTYEAVIRRQAMRKKP